MLLSKYGGEVSGIAVGLRSARPDKQARARRLAQKWVKHRLNSAHHCLREVESLLVEAIVAEVSVRKQP
ncbi:MAG TPA: hypothetical protein VHI93_01345 [Candidatus Thermoplasmatota archaeon]|nr:hypothetical protein [Candidatus Thermoplasmatota archaeon]